MLASDCLTEKGVQVHLYTMRFCPVCRNTASAVAKVNSYL